MKYDKVKNHIIENIRLGIYKDGSKLPSEASLASDVDVSVTTVREALKQLCEQNIIFKQQGRRSVVNASALKNNRGPLRIAWLGTTAFSQMMPVYFETYSKLQKAFLRIDSNLAFLPIQNPRDEENVLGMLHSFDGVFLAGVRQHRIIPALASSLNSMNNVIEVDDIGASPAKYSICTDNYQAGWMSGEYLLSHNRSNIVVFISDGGSWYRGYHQRCCGLIDFLRKNKVKVVTVDCVDDEIGQDSFAQKIGELLSINPKLDTIWHPFDCAAIAIRNVFEKVSPKLPGYYHSCGIDGLYEVVNGESYHASVAHPYVELSRRLFESMLNLCAGIFPEQNVEYIKPEVLPWHEPVSSLCEATL